MTNRRRRPGTRRDLPAGEVQKRGGVASSEVCERLNASNRHRWPGVSPHCLTPESSTLGQDRSPANALLLTWMEVKGQESQGSGGPKLGRLRTRDHEGAPKGQEHVLPSPPALAPGPTLRPAFHHVGQSVSAPRGTGRNGWPEGRGWCAAAASGPQEPEACVRGGRGPLLPATRRVGAGRGCRQECAELHGRGLCATRLDGAGA